MYKHIFSLLIVFMCMFFIYGSYDVFDILQEFITISSYVSKSKSTLNKSDKKYFDVEYWIEVGNGAYVQDEFIFNNTFLSKLKNPYLAVMLPNGTNIDKNSVKLNFEYYEAPKGMTVEQVRNKVNDFSWRNSCIRHSNEFSIDSSQDARILDVFNRMHKPKSGYHWEIVKPDLSKGFELPEQNVFFGMILEFSYKILNPPSDVFNVGYFVSLGKFSLGPVNELVKYEEAKELPDLFFVGPLVTSDINALFVAPGNNIKIARWICNCSNKDLTIRLNAKATEWNLNDFSFYSISNLDTDNGNEYVMGDKIGNNDANMTIKKHSGNSVEGVTFPKYSNFSDCNCKQIAAICNNKAGVYSTSSVVKFTATDIKTNISAESNTVVYEKSNKIYPLLNVYDNGKNLILSWFDPNAVYYKLYYLIEGSTKVQTLDLKKLESAVLPSDKVPSLYMAIQACYADQTCSGISNIEKTH